MITPLQEIHNMNMIRNLMFQIVSISLIRVSIYINAIEKNNTFNNEADFSEFDSSPNESDQLTYVLNQLIESSFILNSLYTFEKGNPEIDKVRNIIFNPTDNYHYYDDNTSFMGFREAVPFIDVIKDYIIWRTNLLGMHPDHQHFNEFFRRKELNNLFLNANNVDGSITEAIEYIQIFVDSY
jgi:hypothetical protein